MIRVFWELMKKVPDDCPNREAIDWVRAPYAYAHRLDIRFKTPKLAA